MKSVLLLLSIFLASTLHAADWDLFPPDQKMYFVNEDANALDWISLKSTAISYTFISDKYSTFSGTNGCAVDSTYYSIGMLEEHQWHIDELYVSPNETIYPNPVSPSLPAFKDQFIYLKNVKIGQFWSISFSDSTNTYSSINITYDAKQAATIYGVQDSIKIFKMEGTKWEPGPGQGQIPIESFNLIVSKSFGVLEFVPFQQFIHNPNHIDYTSIKIVGIEKQGFSGGITPPSLESIVQYQQGEILNWENIIDNINIRLFKDSIINVSYLPDGITYTYDRRIDDMTGNTGTTYQVNLKKSFKFDELTSYTAPPLWGDFHEYSHTTKRLFKNESHFRIDKNLNDTIFRTTLQATDLLLDTSNCNTLAYNTYVDWEVYDKRYGLAEFGNVDQGQITENRLVIPGPCPGIDSSLSCYDIPKNIDCDNGGLTNYQECLQNTNPFDPTDDILQVFPIELLLFNAVLFEEKVYLNWSTALEENSDYFEIQRSSDGTSFEEIGVVQAAGHSNQTLRYRLNDEFPLSGKSYYRLKMVDQDKTFTYSNVKVIRIYREDHQISLYPNPSKSGNVIQLITETNIDTEGIIQIQDITGREIKEIVLLPHSKRHDIDLSGLVPGTYLVRLTFDSKRVTKKLIVN